jgi:dolichol kinase
MPLSIQWLVQFLLEPESGYARFRGLIYWGITLVLCSLPTYALLRLPSNNLPVVVTRKWFHLVAVLLFAPMIWKAPQLMSLSFAIAVCVLFVLEALRRDLPALQSFYVTFIDDNKDEETAIIVSHIFLIVGCAMPLWINEVLQSSGGKSSLLLAQFGVLCIGIGDAMGAVIGKCMGKHIWGRNNRTLEGSFAMLVSMIASGAFCCYSFRDFLALFFATSFVTLLEAFTFQLDNLVLPLAGSTVLLLLL